MTASAALPTDGVASARVERAHSHLHVTGARCRRNRQQYDLTCVYTCIYSLHLMSPKQMISLRLDPALLKAMRAVKDAEGVPVAVQIEKAATEWLEKRGFKLKAERKRAVTRRRS